MSHKYWCLVIEVALLDEAWEFDVEGKPAREANDSGELDLGCQPCEQRHGTALREATDDDAVGRYAGVNLGLDETVDVVSGLHQARFILIASDVLDPAIQGSLISSRLDTR